MKWIHKGKGKFRKQGNRIVTNFVERAWNESAKRYVNCDYDSLKKERRMEKLLVSSQKMAIDINPYLRCESKLKKSCIAVKLLKGFTFSTRPRPCLMESLSSRFV